MALQPAYAFTDSMEPVLLRAGRALLEVQGGHLEADVEMRLRSIPRPRLEIEGIFEPSQGTSVEAMNMDAGAYQLSLDGQAFEVLTLAISCAGDRPALRIKLCPKARPVLLSHDTATKADYVVFHIFDFPNLIHADRGVLQLEDEEWNVMLHQRVDFEKAWSSSREDGMARLTHVGELSKKDGAGFSFNEAEDQLNMLDRFLAFVRGTWCDPVLSVGFDSKGVRIWENLHEPPARCIPAGSWRDIYHTSQIVEVFPLFSKKWRQSDSWRDCLREVIYWYVNANASDGRPGIDAAILLIQAALERLSYQFSVVDKKLMSSEGFKASQFRASDKLRLLLSSNGVPVDIPSSCTALGAVNKWADGPHAFTDVRNALVHADPQRKWSADCEVEAWKLGLWYIELAILAVCGYRGEYGNRLTQRMLGQVEQVPWA